MRFRFVLLLTMTAVVGCSQKPAEEPERGAASDTPAVTGPVDTAPGSLSASPQSRAGTDSIGIRGTELARIDSSRPGWQGYVYRNYAVVVRQDTAGGVGEDIRVALRRADEEGAAVVARAVASPDFVVPNDDANYFFGLFGDRIFIDQGTGPEPRGLAVYDVTSKKKVYADSYSYPINMLDSNRLEFFKEIGQRPPGADCPEQSEWTAGGLGIAWERRVIVDLVTGTEAPSTEVRCAPRQ